MPDAVARAAAETAKQSGVSIDDLPAFGWTVEFKPEHMPPVAPDDKSFAFES